MKNFYKVLGVKSDANAGDIKKAYRRLAQKYHPDKNLGNTAAEQKFKEIVEANETLSNPQKRQEYDLSLSGGGLSGFSNMFENMFGGGFNPFAGGPRRRPTRKQDPTPDSATLSIELTLRDIENGGTMQTFKLTKKIACAACSGFGGDSTSTCIPCHGVGVVLQELRQGGVTFQTKSACAYCGGSGQKIVNPCSICFATGVISVDDTYQITITTEKV